MMNRLATYTLIGVLGLMLIEANAYAADLQQCPKELLVNQVAQDVDTGWKEFNTHEKHPYIGVAFYEGSPDQKAMLAPLKEKKIKGGTIAYWNFPVVSVAYWMSCLYGETSVVVSQMLPIFEVLYTASIALA